MTNISILSIDAWRDHSGWQWNTWHKIGSCPVEVCDWSTRSILFKLRKEGYLSPTSAGEVAIEDDGYNLVVVERNNRCPILALAYGEVR